MNCLLAAATAREIDIFLDHYRKNNKAFLIDIDIVITGVGLTASTYSLTKQIAIKRPGMVIQAGIAGCFGNSLALASTVAVKQDRIADEGVIESNKLNDLFDLGLVEPNHFPYKNGWLINPGKSSLKKNKLNEVTAISVNQVSTDPQMIQHYKTKYNPVIETMEGAALHYVCLSEKLPFLQIRSISNYIGERNKKNWKIKEAIGNLNKELIGLLTS